MGKTPKPLRILIHQSMRDWPEMLALHAQGHEVYTREEDRLDTFDLILLPNAWRMNEELRPYVALSVEAARAKRYPKKGGLV